MARGRRDWLIDQLLWNSGGTGFGICSVANSMNWAMEKPKHPRGEDDLKSVVAISGSPDRYLNEELEKLYAFSQKRTEEYDKMFNWRLGCNLICIGKMAAGGWMRKRLTWDYGPMFSDTLEEAIAVFDRKGI